MELSEAKEKAKQLIDYYFKECDREEELMEYERGHISEDEAIDVIQTLLKALDNSISKNKVIELIAEENVAREEARKENKKEMLVAHEYTRLTLKSLLKE